MPGSRAPWWVYVVAACFAGFFVFFLYAAVTGPTMVTGLAADFAEGTMKAKSVLPNSYAQQGGVQLGDRVLAVDGQGIRSLHDWLAIRANTEAGRAQQWEIERSGRPMRLMVTFPPAGAFALTTGPYLAHQTWILVTLLLGLTIAFRRGYDPVARAGAWLLATASFAFGFPDGWAVALRNLPAAVGLFLWIPQVSRFVLDGIVVTFFMIFPRKFFHAKWPWVLIWAPVLMPLPWRIFANYAEIYRPGHATGAPEWVFSAISMRSVVYFVGAIVALSMNYWRLKDINERRRIHVVTAGIVVSLLVAIAWVSTPSLVLTGSVRSGYAQGILMLLSLAFPFALAYAILRHRLFDVGVMIRQGLQYALARGVLLSAVPAFGGVLLLDLLMHADQPLVNIMRERGWTYVVLGGLALVGHTQRRRWMDALDRRFFRERYDAQRLLREVVEEVRQAGSFERVAPRVAARVEAALHPEFVALLVRDPREASYRSLAAAPAGQAPPPLPSDSKLLALVRVLGKPVEVSLAESGWLKQQLPHEETDFLRQARIELLVPIAVDPERREALLVLGVKRSEEPYTPEDQDLLLAIAASMALLLEKTAATPARVSEAFEECPQCGTCYDTGAARCAQEGAGLVSTRLPRSLVGRYRLERRRGRGGMGAVYEALDTALERRVAVKVIRDDLVGSVEAAERFRREARTAASFTHPNVVTVYDFGVAENQRAFLVMELLEGCTLREELREAKRLSPAHALEIMRGVCSAVDAAHSRQLIHRDLKPENIFLARGQTGEVPKVLDFGIAKFLPGPQQLTADTGTGVLMGTLLYMAPEQLRGGTPQSAWDLWALAVVAYEMLVGAHPFARPTSAEVQGALLTGTFTAPTAHWPGASPHWQEFFGKALALDLARRPSSASAFLTQLEQALS